MQIGIFSDLLKGLMKDENLTKTTIMHEWLQEHECNIAYSSLVRYVSGSACPSFGKAKSILKAFKYEISDEELQELLDNSKKATDENDSSIMKGTVLSSKDFDISVVQLEELITQRILETEAPSFSKYVSNLIKDDLIKNGLL